MKLVKVLKVYFTVTIKFKTEINISQENNTNTIGQLKNLPEIYTRKSRLGFAKDNKWIL